MRIGNPRRLQSKDDLTYIVHYRNLKDLKRNMTGMCLSLCFLASPQQNVHKL